MSNIIKSLRKQITDLKAKLKAPKRVSQGWWLIKEKTKLGSSRNPTVYKSSKW